MLASRMPTLTQQQAEALRVLDWLFSNRDEDRRTGRSYVIALAHIRAAVRAPGAWVSIENITGFGGDRDQTGFLLNDIQRTAVDLGFSLEVDRNWNRGRGRVRVLQTAGWAHALGRLADIQIVESETIFPPRPPERRPLLMVPPGMMQVIPIEEEQEPELTPPRPRRPRRIVPAIAPVATEPERPRPTAWEHLNGPDQIGVDQGDEVVR